MSKYEALRDLLNRQKGDRISLSFSQLDKLVDGGLPESARTHPSWWGNELGVSAHAQCKAWMEAGWEVESVALGVSVAFRRVKT